jgi:predicted glycoside hydrolase/deacetylase ChbG (UPF0249 family)
MQSNRGKTADQAGAQVVLHADDLGFNRAVTDGILRGFAHGPLTSAALLANAPDAARALDLWKQLLQDQQANSLPSLALRQRLGDPQRPFDLGIHLNLTQGRPLTGSRYPQKLLDQAGRFPGIFALCRRLRRPGPKVIAAVKAELCCQVEVLLDHGLRPTHLNGHQYVEMIPAVADIIPQLLEKFGIRVVRVAVERSLLRSTLRGRLAAPRWLLAQVKQWYARRFRGRMDRLGVAHPDWFFGTVHAGHIDMRVMRVFLGHSGGFRLVEIGLHPAEAAPPAVPAQAADGWHDPLAALRPRELRMLLSPELAEYLQSQRLRLGRLSDLAAPPANTIPHGPTMNQGCRSC